MLQLPETMDQLSLVNSTGAEKVPCFTSISCKTVLLN